MNAHAIGLLDALRDEIRDVRSTIVGLIARMDDIMLQQIPQIRADYALKIGCWEQALLEAELAGRRARRRLALAQAQVNQGKAPQMDAIETVLDHEFSEWVTKAEQARIAFEQQLSFLSGTRQMNPAEAREFKCLYLTLVKRLHPDVCHTTDPRYAGLFKLAQKAYRNGDVQALRSLEVATRHLDPATDDLSGVRVVEELEQELELARIEEGIMRERLAQLEECEEMRLGQLLANPEWVTARTEELRGAVEQWELVRKECDERIRELEEVFDGR